MENRMVRLGSLHAWGSCTGALLCFSHQACAAPRHLGAQHTTHQPLRLLALLQVTRCVTNVGSDFYTGVTAALITRSGTPAWVPASLKDVSEGAPCPLAADWLIVAGVPGRWDPLLGGLCVAVEPRRLPRV